VRKLQPIEIAEGALMADLAVIFQLLIIYVPFVGDFFRMPIFVVFAVLVLRRGLYVGIMSMFVAWFIVSVTVGPHYIIGTALEIIGGLFLGVTMKYRLRHSLLLVSGVSGGALALYCLTFLITVLLGTPLDTFVLSLHQFYNSVIVAITALMTRMGLENWWRLQLYPMVTVLATWGFNYWWLSYYLGLWVISWSFVLPVYAVTNLLVRLLGYDVRPFPGVWFSRLLQRGRRRIMRLAMRRGLIGTRREKA
jgi:uncharacterized protein YybS (DUF2232 family)